MPSSDGARPNGRFLSSLFWGILCVSLLPMAASAQISVTEPNLHNDEPVYGLEVTASTSPQTNSQDVSLLALGETDPLLYTDVRFYAYGLYCNLADVNIVNTGAIDVNAVGGRTTANGSVDADIRAYGIRAVGDVNNIGDILVSVLGGTTSVPASVAGIWTEAETHVYAYGIDTDGDVNNTGGITVTAAGGTATTVADANDTYGDADADTDVRADGIDAGGAVDNSGAIVVTGTAGTATATVVDANDTLMSAYADAYTHIEGIDAIGDVNNTGAVTVTGTGGTATATTVADANDNRVDVDADADAYAEGIEGGGRVTNTGAITVTATGGTARAEASATTNPSSYADAYADASAHGVDAEGAVTNSGDVTVTARAGTARAVSLGEVEADTDADAWAVGIDAYGALTNTGDVVSTATAGVATSTTDQGDASAYASAVALGIAAHGTATNSGAVVVSARGGTATASANADDASVRADASVQAVGIYARAALTNTGDVTVTAAGGVTTASTTSGDATAYGIYGGADVNNAGDVTVTATAEEGSTATAYGFYLGGSGTLTNTGTVRTIGDQTYEVYVTHGTPRLEGVYNVTLDGDPNDASFYVDSGATLALNDALLTVTGIDGVTTWDTEYRLFETVDTNSVTGDFNDVQAVNPDTAVTYYDQGTTSDASDDTVSLSYSPSATEATGSIAVEKQLVAQSITVVNQHMTRTVLGGVLSAGTSGLLADAGSTADVLGLANSDTSSTSGVFIEPYYSRMEHDSNPLGYDADLWGFAAGYERQFDETLIGLNFSYGRADIDYTGAGYSANSEDQDIISVGFSGLTKRNEWTLRYGLTGFYGMHDYEGLTGSSLTVTEKSDTDSYGVVTSVLAGRIFQRGSHVLLPEVGVNYLWGHRQRYTSDASDPAWDTTYSALNDHDVQAEASLNWLCGFMHEDIHVTPSASIGIRRLLTDNDSSVRQSVPGATPVSVSSERDRTALTLSGSVVLRKARHGLSLAYDGEYSPDTERHSLWLRYGWQF